MLAHIVSKLNPRRYSLDNAKAMSVHIVEHIDEQVTSSRGKRKRSLGRACATNLLDEGVYETMTLCCTREFIFDSVLVELSEGGSDTINNFSVLIAAQFMGTFLPPPRITKDNTADDNLHNDLLRWF